MGRSRKCNWKRKQAKANKKKGPVMLTGEEYFKLNALGQTKSLGTIVLKNRRGGYVIGYSSNSEAKKAYEIMKKALQDNRIIELNYSSEPHKLRGGAPDYMDMFRTVDGRYIDPELGDINPEEYKKFWPEVVPKMNSKRIGVPMIFGTAGHDTVGNYYHNLWHENKAFNIVAGADAADENSEIHAMDLSLGPHIQRLIAEQKRWRAIYFGEIEDLKLPKDFFEYDPNGRNK